MEIEGAGYIAVLDFDDYCFGPLFLELLKTSHPTNRQFSDFLAG